MVDDDRRSCACSCNCRRPKAASPTVRLTVDQHVCLTAASFSFFALFLLFSVLPGTRTKFGCQASFRRRIRKKEDCWHFADFSRMGRRRTMIAPRLRHKLLNTGALLAVLLLVLLSSTTKASTRFFTWPWVFYGQLFLLLPVVLLGWRLAAHPLFWRKAWTVLAV